MERDLVKPIAATVSVRCTDPVPLCPRCHNPMVYVSKVLSNVYPAVVSRASGRFVRVFRCNQCGIERRIRAEHAGAAPRRSL